jgi:aryl-alcohol dehydrogenase-like predicted oxidoreductase
MQLAGDNVFGPPRDRDEALQVLRTAVDRGVNHIDTAQYYGPGVVNELIREALHPYPADLAIVSKVAARRDAAGAVLPFDEPDQLRHGIEENLATLGVSRLAAVNLRMMGQSAPGRRFDAQLASLVRARDEGLIGGIGLSNISREHLLRAVGQTQAIRNRLAQLAADAGVSVEVAQHLALLAEGATTTAAISGSPLPARQAKQAATILIDAELGLAAPPRVAARRARRNAQ